MPLRIDGPEPEKTFEQLQRDWALRVDEVLEGPLHKLGIDLDHPRGAGGRFIKRDNGVTNVEEVPDAPVSGARLPS